MRIIILFILLLHGCGKGFQSTPRIGMDPTWAPLAFGTQVNEINGYTEDFLLELANYNEMKLERIPSNWDSLLDGLNKKKYDAVLTSLPPYDFNTAKYDFSKNYLDLGPVLIVPYSAKKTNLNKIKVAGLLTGVSSASLLENHPNLIIRNYDSIPDLLNAVWIGEIDAAVLARVPAVNYVRDLYAGQLKIVGEPLSDAGLHLVTLKGEQHDLIRAFDRTVEKKSDLQKKWGLN